MRQPRESEVNGSRDALLGERLPEYQSQDKDLGIYTFGCEKSLYRDSHVAFQFISKEAGRYVEA
jgi:hypothetical protein